MPVLCLNFEESANKFIKDIFVNETVKIGKSLIYTPRYLRKRFVSNWHKRITIFKFKYKKFLDCQFC